MSTSWLIDKSALVRLGSSPDAEEWAERIERGLVTITTVTLLEAGFSARSAVEDRAVQVQRLLAERGQHRAPSIPDLLIAAAAELNHRPGPNGASGPSKHRPPQCRARRPADRLGARALRSAGPREVAWTSPT